jgi:hypothetical protein
MNASEYLKHKKAAQTNFIHRQKTVDASLYTEIKRKAADSYFIPPNQTVPVEVTGLKGSGAATAVKPHNGCESAAMCSQLSDPYTTPYISTPCCEIPYPAPATYQSPCKVQPFQSTRAQVAAITDRCCNGL